MGEWEASGDRLDLDEPVVTKHGKPVARVVPHGKDADLIGSLRHKTEVRGDIFTTGVSWADAEAAS